MPTIQNGIEIICRFFDTPHPNLLRHYVLVTSFRTRLEIY